MKKRTEKPEHIPLEIRRLPENIELANDYRLRMRAWKESNHYLKTDFPRRRFYVVLLKHKMTGMIYAFNSSAKSLISNKSSKLFTTGLPYSGANGKFNITEYRRLDGYTGHEQALKAVKMLKSKGNSNLYDIFVSRVGSSKCPVKLKLQTDNISWAEFTVKNQ